MEQATETPTITRATVPEHERMEFLPARVGPRRMLTFEGAIYATLTDWTNGSYNGGYWEFYALSNGGWYLAPRASVDTYALAIPANFYRGHLSPDAAGVAVSLACINHLLWQVNAADSALGAKLHDAFYNLRAYACEHPEAGEILGAID